MEPDRAAGPRVLPAFKEAARKAEKAIKDRKQATLPELVVAALRASGLTVFSREDIVMLAFQAYPERFGLRGYGDVPDSSRVYALLDGKRGLVGRGLVSKDEDGYRLA